ncbi:hypothetical protein [Aequorivita nionensis]|jgi:hypothetical protein|uniref:hypothetical protein n=1 Tax=Aequorivita nionensis TaxID=1287690 RepID=UPI00396594AF
MKKLIPLIFLLLIFNSCNKKTETEITLISNSTTWVGYKDFHFEKELILCGVDSVAQIKLTKKLNENDTIYSGIDDSDNRFVYSTRPNEAGYFEIKGKVILQGKEMDFSQNIAILHKAEPVGFNTKNSSDLKVGVENEIKIIIGVPKIYRTLKTNNGQIIETDNKTIIIPERTGTCEIEIDVKLPSDEPIEFSNVIFNVTE